MSKARGKMVFICQECGYHSPKPMGRCPECEQWNTFVQREESPQRRAASAGAARPRELSRIPTADAPRLKTPFAELDRVLGGGIVPGSMVLLGGEPGMGKSTLLLQATALMAEAAGPVLYVSGEESETQIKMRARRLGLEGKGLYLSAETDLETILEQVQETAPRLLIVDSIQAVQLEGLGTPPGSLGQVRECAQHLRPWVKGRGLATFLVGHVTKEGAIAGPHALEHIVDAVLYLEGEPHSPYRLLRSVKNRFGPTHEVGIFQMGERGMEEVADPSRAFLEERMETAIGSAVVPTLEGTRPLLVEVQALASPTPFGTPRRVANGVDYNRLLMVAAVLSKRLGFPLGSQDIIVNVVGGLRVTEPAADLAIAMALVSSLRDIRISPGLVAVGEVGLSGELRSVGQMERRLAEAAQMGFRACLLPRTAARRLTGPLPLELRPAATLSEALSVALG
ncbi:MAG: DNA repair protein RadA [Chloroflexi bacterium]|nr:DNA repair protein RadA [Chloroflexota bacterium]